MYYVPDHFKTQGLRNDAVEEEPSSLQYVSDYFVTQEQIKKWHDDDYDNEGGYWDDNDDDDEDKFFEWYGGYQKRKAQKVLRLRYFSTSYSTL